MKHRTTLIAALLVLASASGSVAAQRGATRATPGAVRPTAPPAAATATDNTTATTNNNIPAAAGRVAPFVLRNATVSPGVAGLNAYVRAPRGPVPFGDPRYSSLRPTPVPAANTLPPAPAAGIVLVLQNTGAAPISIRTESDDGGHWDVALHGPGAVALPVIADVTDIEVIGLWQTIAPGATLEIPLATLTGGPRIQNVRSYWTTPGAYTLDVALHAHVLTGPMRSSGATGSLVTLQATGVALNVAAP